MEKLVFRKNLITIELFHQPYMHVVMAFTCSLLYCVILPAYSMCWPVSGCNISRCRLFRRSLEPPPAKYACSDRLYSSLLYGVNLPVHSMYWPSVAATSHVAGILRRVSDTLGLRFLHSTLSLVLMGIHNLVTSAIWIEVIVFTLLYTCDLPLL